MRKVTVGVLLGVLGFSLSALAQPLGSFRWQLQPYCNVLTVTVTQQGSLYLIDGWDDACGAPKRASATGLAQVNPDGTIGFGLTIVTAPGAQGLHVSASISLATLGGTWSDSDGRTGTFVFTPGAPVAGPARPSGPVYFRTASFSSLPVADNTLVPITAWSSVEVNEGGGTYDSSTGTFTVPATGRYLLTCRVRWTNFTQLGSAPRMGLTLSRNGTGLDLILDTPSLVNQFQVQELNTARQLTAGDQIRCNAFQNSGATQTLGSGAATNSNFTIAQLR